MKPTFYAGLLVVFMVLAGLLFASAAVDCIGADYTPALWFISHTVLGYLALFAAMGSLQGYHFACWRYRFARSLVAAVYECDSVPCPVHTPRKRLLA